MEIEGRSAEELCQEAFEFLQQGRLAAAVERLEKVAAARPDYFDAHHYLGIAYGYMGRMEEAEQHLRKAVELVPDNAPARYNLGLVLHYRGKHEEAMREFRQSLELNPYYEPVRKILAELGEPVEQMVEEILEAQAATEEERKTFAEKFAEAPWAALREREVELAAAPPAVEEEEKPAERPLSNLGARAVATTLDALFYFILYIGLAIFLGPLISKAVLGPAVGLLRPAGPGPSMQLPKGGGKGALPGVAPALPGEPGAKSEEELRKALEKVLKQAQQGRQLSPEELRKLREQAKRARREVRKSIAQMLESIPMGKRLLWLILPLGFSLVYFGLTWSLLGKSAGKAILGLEVAGPDFRRAAPWRGIVRWVVFWLPFIGYEAVHVYRPSLFVFKPSLIFLFLLGIIGYYIVEGALIAITPGKKALHDFAAGTTVVGRSLSPWLSAVLVVGIVLVAIGLFVVLAVVIGIAALALFMKSLSSAKPSFLP